MEVYPPQAEGGANHSWSNQVDDEEAWGRQSSRCHKRHRGASEYEGDPQTAPPFSFSDEARAAAVEKLFNEAQATLSAHSAWARLTLQHNIPASQCMDQGIVQLTNLLLVCVSEFHLTRSIRGCGPMILPKIEGQLRDIRDYLPHDNTGFPSTDVWEKDKANLMRLACWFHVLNMAFSYSRGTAEFLRKEDHMEICNLLHYLIAPGLGTLTCTEVIEQVLMENEDDTL